MNKSSKDINLFLNSHFSTLNWERGQALITLLFFAIVGITVTSAAVVMILVNSISGTKQQQGDIAYDVAQSGMEDAIIRKLRDPNYSGGDLQVGSSTNIAHIQVSGSGTSGDPYIITSIGTSGNFTREIQVKAIYQNNLFTIQSRSEVF